MCILFSFGPGGPLRHLEMPLILPRNMAIFLASKVRTGKINTKVASGTLQNGSKE
jgi:hypothetical protein